MGSRGRDIVGERIGRLLVLGTLDETPSKKEFYVCECDCGDIVSVRRDLLVAGTKQSCGCLKREALPPRAWYPSHGLSKTPEYRCWQGMLQRCNNKEAQCYSDYGGRGIKVCDRWFKFTSFYEDMGKRPSPKHSLDRIDNNSHYSPENCRWVTSIGQQNNKRNCVWVEYRGRSQTVAQWAREFGVPVILLHNRIRNGWSMEKAINTPVSGKRSSQ